MTTTTIKVPGRVWDDFLDPLISGMQAELGLPQPKRVNAGKGWRAVYENVPTEVARELADYLYDRGDTLLGQGVSDPDDPFEKAGRDTYRAAIVVSGKIREAAIRADGMAKAIDSPVRRG